MKKILAAVLFFLAMLGGCNGGGGNHDAPPPVDNNPPPPAPPPTTAIGTEQGAAVSKVIGVNGGELQSGDGSVALVVPAGAFNADTTVSIQPISNEAESLGGVGTAFRIQPEGLRSNVPMTLSFHADAAALRGTALRFIDVGYQDGEGHWRVIENPQYNDGTDTVSIQTNHFSDWSMLTGVQLRPSSANVKTGASLELQIRFCTQIEYTVPNEDDDLIPTLYGCTETKDVTYGAGNWSVNGSPGGSEFGGTVVADADSATNKATYTAPPAVPQVNPVAVSVEVLDPENPGEWTLLVSNVKIIEDVTCATLKGVETISAAVAYDRFEWQASTENQSYEGQGSGRLSGTMTNIIPAATRDLSPIGIWSSQNSAHAGLVTMDDTRQLFYPDETVTETAVGNGLPYIGVDVPSFITLTVNYATCKYELVANFVVLGTVTSDGVSMEAPIIPGGIYYSEALPADFFLNGVQRDVALPARYDSDDKLNGYYPAGQNGELRAQGSTQGHWELQFAQ
jgi:hypothetical protein